MTKEGPLPYLAVRHVEHLSHGTSRGLTCRASKTRNNVCGAGARICDNVYVTGGVCRGTSYAAGERRYSGTSSARHLRRIKGRLLDLDVLTREGFTSSVVMQSQGLLIRHFVRLRACAHQWCVSLLLFSCLSLRNQVSTLPSTWLRSSVHLHLHLALFLFPIFPLTTNLTRPARCMLLPRLPFLRCV